MAEGGYGMSCEHDKPYTMHNTTPNNRDERERERLFAIAAAANSAQDPDEVLLMIRNAILEVGGFDRCGVWLMEDGILHGTWGTDEDGDLRDEHGLIYHPSELSIDHRRIWHEHAPYDIGICNYVHVPGQDVRSHPDAYSYCAVALRARGELIGVVFADNRISGKPIYDEEMMALLPFTECLATTVANARLLAERERHLEQQHRLTRISTAINARLPLSDLLRMVRDTVVEVCGVDRAAIFVIDHNSQVLRGAWGTDREGHPEDISSEIADIHDPNHFLIMDVARGEAEYSLLEDFTDFCNLPPESNMYGVHAHAIVPLRAKREILGVLCVDNLLRDTPITRKDIAGLRPFAEQAAVAIQSDRLFAQLCQAQEALVRSERLSAIGELADGIAHNINNILTAVLGYAELIQHEPEVTQQTREYAHIIAQAALEGAEIANRMMQFANREVYLGKTVFELAAVVREAIELTRPLWPNHVIGRGAHIEIVIELTPALYVSGVSSEIREVMANLIKNAVEAMPDGGTLMVRCCSRDENAVVDVVDNGIGMDEATRRRVFEPLFTTKGPALGSGLGLAVVWGIIERHNGHIQVQSQPGAGTTFSIVLPLAPATRLVHANPSEQL
jgi:signal transduction histidine kinase